MEPTDARSLGINRGSTVRNRLPILLLVLSIGHLCACAGPDSGRLKAGNAPRGELAMMYKSVAHARFPNDEGALDSVSWLTIDVHDKPDHTDTRVWIGRDDTMCQRDWAPVEDVGYVLFRSGSTEPVAYAGELGSCAKEPPLPEKYRNHNRFRCTFAEDVTVEIHGYAWPAEIGEDMDAVPLSRRRAGIVRNRVRSTAIPNRISGFRVHGTEFSRVPTSQGETVIGVAFVVRPSVDSYRVRAPRFYAGSGPAISSDSRDLLETYIWRSWTSEIPGDIRSYGKPGEGMKRQDDGVTEMVYPPWLRVQRFRSVYRQTFPRTEFRSHPFVEWTESIVENDCDPSGIEPPTP